MAGRRDLRLLRTTHDGYGELNKRVQRAKIKLLKLHYKDEKVFPFEKDITKLKEQFQVLEKDRHASYLGSRQVETLLRGMNTTDAGIEAAKTTVFHSMQYNFDRAFSSCPPTSRASTRRRNTHLPTNRLLLGNVAISARPGPTLTAVVAVEVTAQAIAVVASLGATVVGVAGPMDTHAHT
jgi:hypothetical protein